MPVFSGQTLHKDSQVINETNGLSKQILEKINEDKMIGLACHHFISN